MRKWLAAPLLAVGLWFVGGSLPALAGSPGVQGDGEESLRSILGRTVCVADNNGLVWNLTIGGGTITGTVSGLICDDNRTVTGRNSGARFTLFAPDRGGLDCCDFRYDGVADKPSRTASGIWHNIDCDGGGEGLFFAGLC